MNAKKFLFIGDMSMALALAAAVVGALSVMSLDSMAFAKNGSDDGASSSSDDNGGDRSGSSHDDDDDDHDDDHGGRGGDDDDDDYDDDHGGNGKDDDDDIVLGDGVVLPEDLAAAVAGLQGAGFEVLTIKREDRGVVEAKVVDATGVTYEIYYDPATNTVLRQQLED